MNPPRIWFLTRSWLPSQTGGVIIRQAQVEGLRKRGYAVTVVVPGDPISGENDDEVLRIPLSRFHSKAHRLEQFGLVGDYLSGWVKKAREILLPRIGDSDVLFATSGGEMGMAMLAGEIVRKKQIKAVLNLHDPFDHTTVNGFMVPTRFYLGNRDRHEAKLLPMFNAIITSCSSFENFLKIKYPQISDKIKNIPFGWFKNQDNVQILDPESSLNIVYGGAMSAAQSPEILAKTVRDLSASNIRAHFFGDISPYTPMQQEFGPNVEVHGHLPYESYASWLRSNGHVGYVSLNDPYYSACIPSKIFEYINLGLPMLGMLPDGQAKDLINHQGFGIAVGINDLDGLAQAMLRFNNLEFRQSCHRKILQSKYNWSMEKHISDVLSLTEDICKSC